jgi:peptidoglycan/LPS O-acetylase OafA/YrhL
MLPYRREIDGLRALAVLPVMLFHTGIETFRGGYVGVDVFFVISGYLITSIILTEKQQGTFTLAGFYERRARRILPALLVVMLACLPFAWFWMLPGDLAAFSASLVAVATFTSNVLFWRESGYFASATELKPLLHTWSLAVEEQYYLFFPVLLLLLWRLGPRWIVGLVASVAALSLALAHWGAYYHPEATFYLLPTRVWELFLGVLTAFYLFRTEPFSVPSRVQQFGSLLGLALLGYTVYAFDTHTPFPSAYALIPTLGTACLILCATPQTFVGKFLGCRALVGIGLISYSAYLWHQPLFAFARHQSVRAPSTLQLLGLILAALCLAAITWKYIETPCRHRQRLSRSALISMLGAGALLIMGAGLVGYTAKGFVDRYSSADRQLAGLDFGESGNYVRKAFKERLRVEFDGSMPRRRVLVIGDSFAKDFVNAVMESDLSASMQLSTYELGFQCGNLFVERDLTAYILPVDQPQCEQARNRDPALKQRMREADLIVLASEWREWEAELLPESLANIQQHAHGTTVVLGRKNFGTIDLKALLQVSPRDRRLHRNAVSAEHARINQLMRQRIPRGSFLDMADLLCGRDASCPLFTERGELISYDGAHLTKAGAAYVGTKLSAHPLLMRRAQG